MNRLVHGWVRKAVLATLVGAVLLVIVWSRSTHNAEASGMRERMARVPMIACGPDGCKLIDVDRYKPDQHESSAEPD